MLHHPRQERFHAPVRVARKTERAGEARHHWLGDEANEAAQACIAGDAVAPQPIDLARGKRAQDRLVGMNAALYVKGET